MKNLIKIIFVLFFISTSYSQGWSDFEDGTSEYWTNTDSSTLLLTNELHENPSPYNEYFLQKECDGSNGPLGEMAIINNSEDWIGNYPIGFFDAFAELSFLVKNVNDFDLHIRIGYRGGSDNTKIISNNSIIVPSFSDWTYIGFETFIEGFTIVEGNNTVDEVFENSLESKIIHNNNLSYDGLVVDGFFMIDDLSSIYLLSSNDYNSLTNVLLYPNPVNDFLTIKLPYNANAEVSIYNILGKKIMSKSFSGVTNQIDISNLNSGMYLVTIKTETAIVTKKIVKL
ncbi:MAG: T9SS type A sorting domain-containing protein [Flavobacteriaceae bacterium]